MMTDTFCSRYQDVTLSGWEYDAITRRNKDAIDTNQAQYLCGCEGYEQICEENKLD